LILAVLPDLMRPTIDLKESAISLI